MGEEGGEGGFGVGFGFGIFDAFGGWVFGGGEEGGVFFVFLVLVFGHGCGFVGVVVVKGLLVGLGERV